MSQAFVTCPKTNGFVYVGLNLEWTALDCLDIGEQTIDCPESGQVHTWSKEDLILRADGGA